MKILIIRFSSLGDIVLTTPVIRCLKNQLEGVELHFLCKERMAPALGDNPYLSRVIFFDKHDRRLPAVLKEEQYDAVVDLQNNRYSRRLVRRLGKKHLAFPKLDFRKLLLVLFKWNLMPDIHIVERYLEAVRPLGVCHDGKGLDYFLKEEDFRRLDGFGLPAHYVAVAVGSQHATKQIPVEKLAEIKRLTRLPFVFLGDARDALLVRELCAESSAFNLCGQLPLSVSAACISRADFVLTGDTGLMHIASALHKKTVSLWGNTVPQFGMYPYQPENREYVYIVENKTLCCRPCSKLGYSRCPLGHFKCMRGIPATKVADILNGKTE